SAESSTTRMRAIGSSGRGGGQEPPVCRQRLPAPGRELGDLLGSPPCAGNIPWCGDVVLLRGGTPRTADAVASRCPEAPTERERDPASSHGGARASVEPPELRPDPPRGGVGRRLSRRHLHLQRDGEARRDPALGGVLVHCHAGGG